METWLWFLPSLLALCIIQKEMSCFFCKQWNKSVAIVSHASSVLLGWSGRWDLDQFFICTSILGIDNLLRRKHIFSTRMCSHPLDDRFFAWLRQSKEALGLILAALDSHSIGFLRTELIQLISVRSFRIIVVQNVDKYWKEIYSASKD